MERVDRRGGFEDGTAAVDVDGADATRVGDEAESPRAARLPDRIDRRHPRFEQPVAGPVAGDDPQLVAAQVGDPFAVRRPGGPADRAAAGERPAHLPERVDGGKLVLSGGRDVEAVRGPGRFAIGAEQPPRTVLADDPGPAGRVDEQAAGRRQRGERRLRGLAGGVDRIADPMTDGGAGGADQAASRPTATAACRPRRPPVRRRGLSAGGDAA